MSVENARGKNAQPANIGDAVPGTVVELPTELTHIEPTRNDEATQQGSTQPGGGGAVMVVGPPSWKEKVVGYAKKFRGTMLRKPGTKEHGDKILEGQATVDDPNKVPDNSERVQ